MDLRDAKWDVVAPLFRPKQRLEKRGRPPQEARAVLNGVLWVLRTGAPWHDLPERVPPYQTCHRCFQQWQQDGTMVALLRVQVQDGRRLRRYLRRWKIERLFAWLHNFRRLVTRWEYYLSNFLGMVQLGCAAILLRYF
ncbi:MAG: transposase [Acidobacteriales bacterium]|nr:transposase [Terriglobales bacterium]